MPAAAAVRTDNLRSQLTTAKARSEFGLVGTVGRAFSSAT